MIRGTVVNKRLKKILKRRTIILDGAVGTELQKRGMPVGVCPEQWCIDNADVLCKVHNDYIQAGADIVYTATFGANEIKLGKYGLDDVRNINKQLALIARKAAGSKTLVAGAIGPMGQFVFPFGEMTFEMAVDVFKEQAQGLIDGGVDIFIIETMMDLQEARAAVIAIKELTDNPIFITMTFDGSLRTLNGNDPISCLVTLQSLGVFAFGCNCSLGPREMIKVIKQIKPYAEVPVIAKANAGLPKLDNNKTFYEMNAFEFADVSVELIENGVNVIGGCCGTTPEFIKCIVDKLANVSAVWSGGVEVTAVCSSRKTVFMDQSRFLCIGEKINPTGKKKFQQALKENNFSVIREVAVNQIANGADLLDVNVGVAGINECEVLCEVIGLLSRFVDAPLVIDTSNIAALELALRVYPGRALVNSVSAEDVKIHAVLPLIRKYGAMFIALPLNDRAIPKTFIERKKNILHILKRADKFKIPRRSVIVDGLMLAVSSNPEVMKEILAIIKWVSGDLKLNTTCGLSNVSYGLPSRDLVNSAFLKLARDSGLSTAIMAPEIINIPVVEHAIALLKGEDRDARRYVEIVRNGSNSRLEDISTANVAGYEMKVYKAVVNGERDEINAVIDGALLENIKPDILLSQYMVKAITDVGVQFEEKEIFLPQLLASAETMKKGVAKLKPLLKVKADAKDMRVILATVEGDIHDIGKNIVALMIENYGIEIIDLGSDVSAERIVSAAKKHKPLAIGISALMTTTMVKMRDVVELARANNVKCPVIVGGAVVTKNYAESIGAIYTKDGVAMVKLLQKISKEA